MKLLIDVNLSPRWVAFFASKGFEAVHWTSVGNCAAPDSEILDFARLNGFTVFTNDLDFGTLLASRKVRHPSVIQVRCQEVLPASIGMVVVLTLQEHESYIEAGSLVTVDLVKSRVRILPM